MRYETKRLKDIPEDLRPTEKLIHSGPQTLSDAELLAVVLRTGTREKDILSLCRELVEKGWKNLERMSIKELIDAFGVGKVKGAQIKALIELSRRIREPYNGVRIMSPEDAFNFLRGRFDNAKETLIALYLDTANRVAEVETVAVGSLNRVFAEPRDILKKAVETSSYGIILAHNHPGGTPHPSEEDIRFTKRVQEACQILGYSLIDHLIIADDSFTSLRAEGLL